MAAEARFLALRDRAHALIAAQGAVSEETLLAHVYGGATPASLRAQLLAPLRGDPRFLGSPDGTWTLVSASPPGEGRALAFTALALAATGPSPQRAAIVCVAALAVHDGSVGERFMATVNPGRRVPRYVAARLGLDPALLEGLMPLDSVLDALVRFLGVRPIVAQDAELTWSFLDVAARRCGHVLIKPPLIDVNDLATRVLDLSAKPTLGRVAAQLGISALRIDAPEEEARVLVQVAQRLLEVAEDREIELVAARQARSEPLRRASTAHALPDSPGVYTMLDSEQQPVYVGKARRLRSRLAAYVQRPLGATRRLEGLVGAVESVEPVECETDLEALVLEDREIRRLEPRFNTVRQSRAPRLWIRLPPLSSRPRAALRRLELAATPDAVEGECVGPFRNQAAAEQARLLAREVFELDQLRRADPFAYEDRLGQAWRFLHGARETAEALARQRSTRLLRAVLAFDVASLLLPADPQLARYVVLRPTVAGVEGFLIDRGVCTGWRTLDDPMLAPEFARELLEASEARTAAEDRDVVVRWLGAQRPPARLVALPADQQAALDAVQDAALALWEARAARLQDALDPFADAALGPPELA